MKEEKQNKKFSFTKAFLENRLKPCEAMREGKGTIEKPEIYPWEWVKPCMNDVLDSIPNSLSCPICGKRSEDLLWIDYMSPKWTWQQLSGRGGALSICQDCHCQVEFICVILN
jgi:hypothetical protein